MIVSSHPMERQQWNLMISIALIEHNYFAKRNSITIKCSLLLAMHYSKAELNLFNFTFIDRQFIFVGELFILHGDKLRWILCMEYFIEWGTFIIFQSLKKSLAELEKLCS